MLPQKISAKHMFLKLTVTVVVDLSTTQYQLNICAQRQYVFAELIFQICLFNPENLALNAHLPLLSLQVAVLQFLLLRDTNYSLCHALLSYCISLCIFTFQTYISNTWCYCLYFLRMYKNFAVTSNFRTVIIVSQSALCR